MRQFNKLRGTKGWLSMYESAIRYRSMKNKQEVARRIKILGFWEIYGTKATKDAFDTGERTLYRWKAALHKEHGKLNALDPKSTAPKNRRKRVVHEGIESFIIHERT